MFNRIKIMKVQKKNLLVERETKHLIVRQAPNEKHNEVTVAIVNYALPLANITKCFSQEMLNMTKKIASGFPDANIEFNFKPEAPAFLFTCKGKTERRGDDVHNQELADKIALAKCRARACAISIKLINAIRKSLANNAKHCDSLVDILQNYHAREVSYIQKV